MTETQNPAEFLRGLYLERRQRNSAYSTRAFARDLGMSQALLSLILSGKRPLTAKQAARIGMLLALPQEETQALLESAVRCLPENSKGYKRLRSNLSSNKPLFKDLETEKLKAIGQWHHLAILDLSTTRDFRSDANWIAKRLGISPIEARDAVARLIDLGLLVKKGGELRKAESQIQFVTRKSEAAVRNLHKSMIAKAQLKLDETADADFRQREISSVTLAARSDRIEAAKKKIQKFQKDLAAFLTEGECDEVFQFNVQLFPLTIQEKTK